jgi:hypothetical protein
MSEQEHWLRELLKENKKDMDDWPDWLKQSAKKSTGDEKTEEDSFDDYEELKQQTG